MLNPTLPYTLDLLNRTSQMLRINGLPDTMPERDVKRILQTCGSMFVTKVDGKLYGFFGGQGGRPNPYYNPTIFTVANPALNFYENARIATEEMLEKGDGVLVRHDSYMQGLLHIFDRYVPLLVECDITLKRLAITARVPWVITAGDDSDKAGADKFLQDVEKGEKLSAIVSDSFYDQLKAQPLSNGASTITDIIELKQYLKASCLNDIGLDANYNMKRESLNSAESQLNNDALLPLVDDILTNTQRGFELVNEKYGTNITVELGEAWKRAQQTPREETLEEVR